MGTTHSDENIRNRRQGFAMPQRSAPRPLPATEKKYARALELYATTDLSTSKISRRCGVPVNCLLNYIYKYYRNLALARRNAHKEGEYNEESDCRQGKKSAAQTKYKEAVAACNNVENIACTISQIARKFGLNPSGFGACLRIHHPEILVRRDAERQRLGLADHRKRGMRPWSKEHYADAIELLHTTEMTIPEAARACHVSAGGLSQHVLSYHRRLQHERKEKREQAKGNKKIGRLTGNGRRHEPRAETIERYREAVQLYEQTSMTIREIAIATGKNENTLYAYLRTWHRKEAFERRGAEYREGVPITTTKQYRRAKAEKYAPAIARLREGDISVAKAAAEYGLHPESFRQYLKEHFPELHAREGMMRTAEGKRISRRSMEKYTEAIRLYETTAEDLHSIARRLGLVYNSLGGFVRRNFPHLIEKRRWTEAERAEGGGTTNACRECPDGEDTP